MEHTVTAGVDGSPESLAAAAWAGVLHHARCPVAVVPHD